MKLSHDHIQVSKVNDGTGTLLDAEVIEDLMQSTDKSKFEVDCR